MAKKSKNSPMRVRLSDEARQSLTETVQHFFRDEIDQELSEFQAQAVIEFFIRRVGAPVYNQAIQDARSFFQEKLEDLDGEFYEPVDPD